jgi:hypothetical protein
VWWQFAKIVQNIPSERLVLGDIAVFDYWLDDPYERGLVTEELGDVLLGFLRKSDDHRRRLAVELVRTLYKLTITTQQLGKHTHKRAVLRFDAYHARELSRKIATPVGRTLALEALEIFRTTLESALTGLGNDRWSSVWRPAIEEHDQNHGADDIEDVIVETYRDALLARIDADKRESEPYVLMLLDRPFETLHRLALFAINKCFEQLKDIAPAAIEKQPFTSNVRHEYWHLLRDRFPWLPRETQALLRERISLEARKDDKGEHSDGATAFARALWLSAIKDYSDDLRKEYAGCIALIGGEPEHPDFPSYMTSGWVDHKSPIPKEELLSLEIEDLAGRLAAYRDPGRFGEPGIEGLAKALREVIKAQPLRFYPKLAAFRSLDWPFVHAPIEAFVELWDAKAQMPWDEAWPSLLDFCVEVVRQDRFWAEDSDRKGSFVANRNWIVSSIARLIESGTRQDEHVLPESLLSRAEELLLLLMEKQRGEEFKNESDAVFLAINSPRGRCLEAFITLTFRCCRLDDRKKTQHADAWSHFKRVYEAEVQRQGEYEFATLLVNRLQLFLYMSSEWTISQLPWVFDSGNNQRWSCGMQAYAYVSHVYKEIFEYLKGHGHFLRALDDKNLKDRVVDKIVQNIAVGYVNDFESLDDDGSLISTLVARKSPHELGQLIWFLWTLRRSAERDKIANKVFPLWGRLVESLDMTAESGKEIAAKSASWIAFVDVLDEANMKLLLAVIPAGAQTWHSHDLIENIARLSENQPAETYQLWRHILEFGAPDYPQQDIGKALANLVRRGPEGMRQAKDIASRYLRHGNERPQQLLVSLLSGTAPQA